MLPLTRSGARRSAGERVRRQHGSRCRDFVSGKLRRSCDAGFWRMAGRECAAMVVGRGTWWPSRAKGRRFCPSCGAGGWWIRRRGWLTRWSSRCRCGSGCCRCRSGCGLCVRRIRQRVLWCRGVRGMPWMLGAGGMGSWWSGGVGRARRSRGGRRRRTAAPVGRTAALLASARSAWWRQAKWCAAQNFLCAEAAEWGEAGLRALEGAAAVMDLPGHH